MTARLLTRRQLLLISLFCAMLAIAAISLRAYLQKSARGLPYHDSFSLGRADEWKAFGGTWELVQGSMRNDSDERGAKLMTGSPHWRDYSIEADVMILGAGGDAGIVLRSSDEEQGVDAYSGYYAGLRSLDNTLVLGRAGHGWVEDVLKLKPPNVQISQWFHLKILAYGCQIAATATIPNGGSATVSVTDRNCITSGRAGLRSYASGGVWRNVVIRPTSDADLRAILGKVNSGQASLGPPAPGENRSAFGFYAPTPRNDLYTFHSSPNTEPISSLRLTFNTKPTSATIRGNVVLTSPLLVVQDSTGGHNRPRHPR